MSFIFLFEILKLLIKDDLNHVLFFFWIPASIAEAAGVITNGAQTFFAKGVATFINGTANLLTKDPKNPPDWIIWEIWALESIKISWHIVIK